MKTRIIAFYLPQFYPTPENDEWWEPGFTEWTNVTRAKPLFKGHYQPRLPRDLGFYDLRVPETRERQAELARQAGIEGFCYWHYWFAGRRLLDRPFREVVESGKPDFPFCLCWANHSWKAKTWNPNVPDKMLIEQTYPGEQDYIDHFYAMLPAFKDKRYMKIDGKLIFGIFAPHKFDDFKQFSDIWNSLANENGLEEFYFFAFVQECIGLNSFDKSLYTNVVMDTLSEGHKYIYHSFIKNVFRGLKRKCSNSYKSYAVNYDHYVDVSLEVFRQYQDFIPCIAPDFDHSPRSAWRGVIYHGSSPEKFENLCREVKELVSKKKESEKIVFVKAWNEWGEGNYLEPDQKFGDAYLKALYNGFKE